MTAVFDDAHVKNLLSGSLRLRKLHLRIDRDWMTNKLAAYMGEIFPYVEIHDGGIYEDSEEGSYDESEEGSEPE